MQYDDETLQMFIEEAKDHLQEVETDLLALEAVPEIGDGERINRLFRGVHSIKGAAGFFGLVRIRDLSHALEDLLNRMRNRELRPVPGLIGALLRASDLLGKLVADPAASDSIAIDGALAELGQAVAAADGAVAIPPPPPPPPMADLGGIDAQRVARASDASPPEASPFGAPISEVPPSEVPLSDVPLSEFDNGGDSHADTAPHAQDREEPRGAARGARVETSSYVRVSVRVLDTLMTLAGELVLTRNQLLRKVNTRDFREIGESALDLSHVVSDLQDAVMSTRMQPIANLFRRFQRVVRDLAGDLGKEIVFQVEGDDVELDKTVIEGLGDPLVHLLRNSIDHGIERPEDRVAAGKPRAGTLHLRAFHEAGKVVIEVEDDGKGIDVERVRRKALEMKLVDAARLQAMTEQESVALVFHPGLSTARQVSDVSGRGVGMDVVRTNLENLGGTVDISTHPGRGTTVRVRIPLTLAIIPSLLVSVEREMFAIPQVNLVELVRVPAAEVKTRIERIGSALVMRLRGRLLPLVRLSDVLGIEDKTWIDDSTGEVRPDRRRNVADRRSPQLDGAGNAQASESPARREGGTDRRFRAQSSISIAVLAAGDFHYGLIVDRFHETEEIVVKPLGRHMSGCRTYAGATILGDGSVALILDAVGMSKAMNLADVGNRARQLRGREESGLLRAGVETQSLLVFTYGKDQFYAAPLSLVSRIELVPAAQIQDTAGQRNIQYRGGTLLLVGIDDVMKAAPLDPVAEHPIVVFPFGGREIGLVASGIVDVVDAPMVFDAASFRQAGVLGSQILMGRTVLLLDLFHLASAKFPEWSPRRADAFKGEAPLILVVDDSDFFRGQVAQFVTEAGYRAVPASDGLEALERLDEHGEEIRAVLTDIEMPRLDGLGLARRIRSQGRYRKLPVVAITSVAGEKAERDGLAAGIDTYLVKLDREKILDTLHRHLGGKK